MYAIDVQTKSTQHENIYYLVAVITRSSRASASSTYNYLQMILTLTGLTLSRLLLNKFVPGSKLLYYCLFDATEHHISVSVKMCLHYKCVLRFRMYTSVVRRQTAMCAESSSSANRYARNNKVPSAHHT